MSKSPDQLFRESLAAYAEAPDEGVDAAEIAVLEGMMQISQEQNLDISKDHIKQIDPNENTPRPALIVKALKENSRLTDHIFESIDRRSTKVHGRAHTDTAGPGVKDQL